MKKIKSISIVSIISLLTISQFSPIYALSNSNFETISTKLETESENLQLQEDLKKLEAKHTGVTLDLNSNKISNIEISYDFKSIEELDLFLQNFNDFLEKGNEIKLEISEQESRIQGVHTIRWWAPNSKWPFNGLATWKNVTYSFDYNIANGKPYFTNANNILISSYTSGLTGVSWRQTGKAVNLYTTNSSKDTAKATVTGYFFLGVSINGAPIGISVNDTWTCSLILK
jgi:hypothetical protein